jgi:electron transfer flavoprotein alpha subunit
MGNTFLIAEHHQNQLKRVTLEVLGELKKQGVNPTILVLGQGLDAIATQISAKSPAKVVCLDNETLKEYTTEGYANAIFNYVSKNSPDMIVVGATSQAKDFLPRLAAKFKVGMANDCVEFKIAGGKLVVRRPVYAGKVSKSVEFLKTPAIFSVRPNVLAPATDGGSAAPVEKLTAETGKIRARIAQVIESQVKKVELTDADIIISGGRSLKNAENFKILNDCAAVVGAAVGASRAAVDAGYAPHDMQVGQTGKTVSPKLYIACGISGAIQHLAGMRTSKIIVAINKDPEAPIFQKADYGLVGDLFEIVPLLTEEFKKLKAHS